MQAYLRLPQLDINEAGVQPTYRGRPDRQDDTQSRPQPNHTRPPNIPQSQRRETPTMRSGQRSSENMPVGVPSQGGRVERNTQSQALRTAFGGQPISPSGANM